MHFDLSDCFPGPWSRLRGAPSSCRSRILFYPRRGLRHGRTMLAKACGTPSIWPPESPGSLNDV